MLMDCMRTVRKSSFFKNKCIFIKCIYYVVKNIAPILLWLLLVPATSLRLVFSFLKPTYLQFYVFLFHLLYHLLVLLSLHPTSKLCNSDGIQFRTWGSTFCQKRQCNLKSLLIKLFLENKWTNSLLILYPDYVINIEGPSFHVYFYNFHRKEHAPMHPSLILSHWANTTENVFNLSPVRDNLATTKKKNPLRTKPFLCCFPCEVNALLRGKFCYYLVGP